jgi:hypothetical protein
VEAGKRQRAVLSRLCCRAAAFQPRRNNPAFIATIGATNDSSRPGPIFTESISAWPLIDGTDQGK